MHNHENNVLLLRTLFIEIRTCAISTRVSVKDKYGFGNLKPISQARMMNYQYLLVMCSVHVYLPHWELKDSSLN